MQKVSSTPPSPRATTYTVADVVRKQAEIEQRLARCEQAILECADKIDEIAAKLGYPVTSIHLTREQLRDMAALIRARVRVRQPQNANVDDDADRELYGPMTSEQRRILSKHLAAVYKDPSQKPE